MGSGSGFAPGFFFSFSSFSFFLFSQFFFLFIMKNFSLKFFISLGLLGKNLVRMIIRCCSITRGWLDEILISKEGFLFLFSQFFFYFIQNTFQSQFFKKRNKPQKNQIHFPRI